MAELGVAAAAIQFIDLGGSILSSLSKLTAEFRDAPRRISTLQGEVQQLIELVRITQSNAAVAAVFNASIDKVILSDTLGKAQRLQRLLEGMHVETSKGLAVRSWAAIRTVKKDRELEVLCEGLERQKSNLLIWFANHNFENMLGVNFSLKALGSQIECFDKNAGESLPLVNEINDRTRTIHKEAKDANQEHKAGLETINSHLECVGKITNESLALVKDVDIRTESVHQEIKMAAKENKSSFHRLGNHVDDLCDITNHSVPLIHDLDQRTQDMYNNLQLVRPSIENSERKIESMIKSEISRPLAELQASLTALITTKEAHLTQVQTHQSTVARAQYQLLSKRNELRSACDALRKEEPGFAVKQFWDIERYRLCSCGPNRQILDLLKKWRYWRLSWESYSQHSNGCPLYRKTQKTQSVRIGCRLPTGVVRRMIDYTFSITSGAGGFAISPQLTVIRVVDEKSSPAFLQVHDLISILESKQGVVHFIEDALRNLRRLFCTGNASPFDVDQDGQTLLHVFLSHLDTSLRSRYLKDFGDWDLQKALLPFLSMCTTLGISHNNIRQHIPWERRVDCTFFGFAYSGCAEWMATFDYLHVNEGWQLSDFSNFLGCHGTIKACLQFPQFVQDSDFGPVSKAILAKREAKLRELISLDYDLGEQDRFGWTPLHLAVYWPVGMDILLAAGVKYDGSFLGYASAGIGEHLTPLEYAIENKQDEAILLLLEKDCATNLRAGSVLANVPRYNYEPSSRVVTATIEALVQRSNRLRRLAIAYLSPYELDRLCISHKDEPIQILDAYAAPTAKALKNVGVKIPEAWDPGRAGATVYHNDSWVSYRHLPIKLADRLWTFGFHDSNVYNENGFTPFHQACLEPNLDMASWLMSHGGDPTTLIRGHSLKAFHLLSQGFRYQIEGSANLRICNMVKPFRNTVTRIAGIYGTSCRDHCQCACSPGGCTPTTILLREVTLTWYEKEHFFFSWCRFVDLSPDAIETCCGELAHMEAFERLGITHVCCKIVPYSVWDRMPQDTIEEIQYEELEMIDQLESWMALYEEERAKFEGSAIQFLGKWSDMLKDELDVPAPFEEYWRRISLWNEETHMPDYFAKPPSVEHGHEVTDVDQDFMCDYSTRPSPVEHGHEEIVEDRACMTDS